METTTKRARRHEPRPVGTIGEQIADAWERLAQGEPVPCDHPMFRHLRDRRRRTR